MISSSDPLHVKLKQQEFAKLKRDVVEVILRVSGKKVKFLLEKHNNNVLDSPYRINSQTKE